MNASERYQEIAKYLYALYGFTLLGITNKFPKNGILMYDYLNPTWTLTIRERSGKFRLPELKGSYEEFVTYALTELKKTYIRKISK